MEASRATGNGTSNAPSTRRTLSRPPHASSLTEAAAGVHRPPGRFRGPVVGVATVRAELAGISPAGVPRQRSRAGPKRTGSNRSPPFMRRGLRKPAPAPGLPRGSPIGAAVPSTGGVSARPAGSATSLPARWGYVPRSGSIRRVTPGFPEAASVRGAVIAGSRHRSRRTGNRPVERVRFWARRDAPRPVPGATVVGWFGSPDRPCHLRGRGHLAAPRTPTYGGRASWPGGDSRFQALVKPKAVCGRAKNVARHW